MTKKDFWVLGDGDLDTGISGRTPSRGFGLGNFGRLEEEETWQKLAEDGRLLSGASGKQLFEISNFF